MRVLIISDIHANLPALDAVLSDAEELGYDVVWCLGDVVGYGPDPNGCIERLQSLSLQAALAGNHDWATLGRLDIDDFNWEARRAILWTREALSPAGRTYLEALADTPLIHGEMTLTHASPRHPIWEYILDTATAQANFAHFTTLFCCVGHTHVPVIFQWQAKEGQSDGVCRALAPVYNQPVALRNDHRLILNPGSVGQPRDSDPRAAYALFDVEALTWHFRRVPYPIEVTQSRMRAAGLPERLIARLSFGW
jgi:predicted phosphodiesterase